MTTPVSVNSTANVDPFAQTGPLWGTFTASPVYNKPFLDLSNPIHIAVILAAVVAGVWIWKRKR